VAKKGFLYIYISNENPTVANVYFDDVKIVQYNAVEQISDYYAFGLAFNSFQRESSVKQDYLYNGKEMQDELNLGWLDYGARMFMSDIGRWGVIDPLADISRRWSPFAYANDNPLRYVDPDGMETREVSTLDQHREWTAGKTERMERRRNGQSGNGSYDMYMPPDKKKSQNTENNAGESSENSDEENDQQGCCPPGMRCEYNSKGEIIRTEPVDERWRTNSDVELAKGIGESMAIAAVSEVAGAYLGSSRLLAWAATRFFASRAGVTVLGRYPTYIELAGELGGKRFNIPVNVWESMSTSERWAANTKFLDRAITRGDQFILSNSAFYAKEGTYFLKELQYLYSKGYKAAADGMSLVKP
jgi:RHS repeat-associated protein